MKGGGDGGGDGDRGDDGGMGRRLTGAVREPPVQGLPYSNKPALFK